MHPPLPLSLFFFFNDTATTEIYTLSLHDALPICVGQCAAVVRETPGGDRVAQHRVARGRGVEQLVLQVRSEEHTSELQSHLNLVCRLLLEKKKNDNSIDIYPIERFIRLLLCNSHA